MRVLLSTHGSRGDVEPLVGLATDLRESGAEVRVCVPPDEELSERPATDPTLVPWPEVAGLVRTDGAAVAARLLLEGSCR